MKKRIFTMATAVLTCSAVILSSCKKDEQIAPKAPTATATQKNISPTFTLDGVATDADDPGLEAAPYAYNDRTENHYSAFSSAEIFNEFVEASGDDELKEKWEVSV